MMRHKREQERMLYLDSKKSQFYRCTVQCRLLCVPKNRHKVHFWTFEVSLAFRKFRGNVKDISIRCERTMGEIFDIETDSIAQEKGRKVHCETVFIRSGAKSKVDRQQWNYDAKDGEIDIPSRTSSSRMCESYELTFWSGNNLHANNGSRLIDFSGRIVLFSETSWKACLSPPSYLIFACDLFFFSRCRLKRRRRKQRWNMEEAHLRFDTLMELSRER